MEAGGEEDTVSELNDRIAELRGEDGYFYLGSPAIGPRVRRTRPCDTSISAAMELWDEMVEHCKTWAASIGASDYFVSLTWTGSEWQFWVEMDGEDKILEDGDTRCLAICNAYLAWVDKA